MISLDRSRSGDPPRESPGKVDLVKPISTQRLLAAALALTSGAIAIVLALFRSRLDAATHDLLLSAGGACAFAASSLALRPKKETPQ